MMYSSNGQECKLIQATEERKAFETNGLKISKLEYIECKFTRSKSSEDVMVKKENDMAPCYDIIKYLG